MTRRPLLLAIALIALAVAAPAVASEDTEDENKAGIQTAPVSFWFDDDIGLLLYGTTDPETGETVDCTPIDEAPTVEEDGTVSGDLPVGCMALVMDGANGDINHSDVVSQTVKTLKEIRADLDGPFGQYVREIAHSDFGKSDKDSDDDADGDDDDTDVDADESDKNKKFEKNDDHGSPDHANAGGRDKTDVDESDDDTSKDDKKGPPDHAKAHGRDK
jgi:hypothetical protein